MTAPGDAPATGPTRAPFARITPEEVAAVPALREAASVLSNLYTIGDEVEALLNGSDFTPHGEREFIADLIDADHVLDFNERWLELLAGAKPRFDDEDEPWLIERPWRSEPHPEYRDCCAEFGAPRESETL